MSRIWEWRIRSGLKSSDKESEYILKVWNKFEMKTLKDYHDLYWKCDFLLLADVLEKFRCNTLKNLNYVQVVIWADQP